MGCDYYNVSAMTDRGWGHTSVHFSDGDDDVTCLCTLGSNYRDVKDFDASTLRSMAMLGAAVALLHGGTLKVEAGGYLYLPSDLPAYVLAAIDKFLPPEPVE